MNNITSITKKKTRIKNSKRNWWLPPPVANSRSRWWEKVPQPAPEECSVPFRSFPLDSPSSFRALEASQHLAMERDLAIQRSRRLFFWRHPQHTLTVCVCVSGTGWPRWRKNLLRYSALGHHHEPESFIFFFAHLLFFFLSQFSHGQKLVANLADGRHATKSDANLYNVTASSSAR